MTQSYESAAALGDHIISEGGEGAISWYCSIPVRKEQVVFHRLICLVTVWYLICISSDALGFQRFEQDVPKSDVYDLITEFAANREKFQKFAVLVQANESYENVKSPDEDGVFYEDFAILDDYANRKLRIDRFKFPTFNQDLEIISAWETRFEDKGRIEFYRGKERAGEFAKNAYAKFVPRFDVWMLPITEISLLEFRNNIGALYWAELFAEENFLWAQGDGVRIRGEWSVGKGENKCYAQVYFDERVGGLPVFARFIHPTDYDERFAKKGQSFLTEIETVWQSIGEGYDPRTVHVFRQNFGKKSETVSTTNREYSFQWKTSLLDDQGHFQNDLFIPGVVDSESVIVRFP